MVRERMQEFIQQILEEEETEFLGGRAKSQRRALVPGERTLHSLATGHGLATPDDQATPSPDGESPLPLWASYTETTEATSRHSRRGFLALERPKRPDTPALSGESTHRRDCPKLSGPPRTAWAPRGPGLHSHSSLT